jgi:hypothetical protein
MVTSTRLAAALALAAVASPALAAGAFGRAPVGEARLAGMRGGFVVPGGLDIAITVQSATKLNGATLFRTVFSVDRGVGELDVSDGAGDVDVKIGGGGIQAGEGVITASRSGGGARISYSAAGLEVTHLAGQAYGTIIANQRNGVAIDTSTTLGLTLRNATPFNLGSAMLRVDGLATDAGIRLTN